MGHETGSDWLLSHRPIAGGALGEVAAQGVD